MNRYCILLTLCCALNGCSESAEKPTATPAGPAPDVATANGSARSSVAGSTNDPVGDPFGDVEPRKRNDRLAIYISPVDGDAGQFDVRVTNRSSDTVGWDRLGTAFVKWTVTDAAGNAVPSRIEPQNEPGRSRGKERFVSLKPGESHEMRFSLADGTPEFSFARFAGEQGAGAIGSESKRVFAFDGVDLPCRIRLLYDAADWDAEDGFAVYFGYRPTDVGIDFDRAESNTIEIAPGSRN